MEESFNGLGSCYTCTLCGQLVYQNTVHVCKASNNWWTGWIQPQQYPLQYEVLNDKVACEPFKTNAVEKNDSGRGFVTVKQKTTLTPLKVIFGTPNIPIGTIIYVRGDLCVDPAAKQEYEVEGQRVVFIPINEIKLIKRFGSYSTTRNV